MRITLTQTYILLVFLTVVTAITAIFGNFNVGVKFIILLAIIKFWLVGFQFMELKKANKFWKITLISFGCIIGFFYTVLL
ncbi:cytochrome C oxidase subunit IV family protein [Myroides sp. JBRI-B21084]|uniref:cytochrome C oxidase subunit IV family protein n=1 Tax=Myroides sp. JBRI-B21084 TaxID=3119977 RepID=UPI0026E1F647|nr:cytochrome C oxidase subunit IV family protein [Paenimyroides cloacae]WKW46482.1 cytochrome C oxidase subunit IV family protein [Paenimyroides cloacae]